MFTGKRPVRTWIGRGEFFCPQCYQQRECKIQVTHQYVTFLMLRISRTGEPEKAVVCTTCKAVFSDAFLEYNPNEADRQFAAEVFRINVLIAMVEGRLEPVEIAMIQRLHKELDGCEPTRDDIENEVRLALAEELDAAQMVRRIGRTLGGEGARIVAQHAYLVASAGGTISSKRQAQLDRFPAGLGISAAGFAQLIDDVRSRPDDQEQES